MTLFRAVCVRLFIYHLIYCYWGHTILCAAVEGRSVSHELSLPIYFNWTWGNFCFLVDKDSDGTLRFQEKQQPWSQAFLIPPCLVVPRLEPVARWKHPGGGGHRRLPGHLHLCALQRPGYHGHVPPCHFGAKGTSLLMFGWFSACFSINWCAHDGLVFLQDPPYFNVRPGGEYRQEAGRELVIPCAASGDPDIPTITWRKVQQMHTQP